MIDQMIVERKRGRIRKKIRTIDGPNMTCVWKKRTTCRKI